MRRLFEILSLIDWITPVAAFVEDVAEGGPLDLDAWTFFIPYDRAVSKGWSEAHIEELLSHFGVRTWGGLVNFGVFSFSVKLEQAAWAEYVLTSNQIPIHERSIGAPRLPTRKEQDSGRKQEKHRDALSFIDDLVDRISSSRLP
jgi:hypothetical protein